MSAGAVYQVEVRDLFRGPIDLLLYLVRKQELDVCTVSLSELIDQFHEYLNVLEWIDFDLAADFLVAAAALVELKSHLALQRDDDEEPEEEVTESVAPESMIEHLLAYKQLREASEVLQEQALAWQDRYPRLEDERPTNKRTIADDIFKDLEIWDLVGAFARLIRKKQEPDPATIRFDETPIHIYVDQIGQRVRQEKRVRFQDLFEKEDHRSRVIGMFLAILELIRHHGYRSEQLRDFDEIWILAPEEDSESQEEGSLIETQEPEEDSEEQSS